MADESASAKQAPLAGVYGLWLQVVLVVAAVCEALAAYISFQRASQMSTLLTKADSGVAKNLQASANWPTALDAATAVAVVVAVVLGVLWHRERQELAARRGVEAPAVTSMGIRLATLLLGLAIVATAVIGRAQATALVGVAPTLRWHAATHLLLAVLFGGAVIVVGRADRRSLPSATTTGGAATEPTTPPASPPSNPPSTTPPSAPPESPGAGS